MQFKGDQLERGAHALQVDIRQLLVQLVGGRGDIPAVKQLHGMLIELSPFVRQLFVIFMNHGQQRQHQRLPGQGPERPRLAYGLVEIAGHERCLFGGHGSPAQDAGPIFGHIGVPALNVGRHLLPGEGRQLSRGEALRKPPARIAPIGVGAAGHDNAAIGKAIGPILDDPLQDDAVALFVDFVQAIQHQQAAVRGHVRLCQIRFQMRGQIARRLLDVIQQMLGRACAQRLGEQIRGIGEVAQADVNRQNRPVDPGGTQHLQPFDLALTLGARVASVSQRRDDEAAERALARAGGAGNHNQWMRGDYLEDGFAHIAHVLFDSLVAAGVQLLHAHIVKLPLVRPDIDRRIQLMQRGRGVMLRRRVNRGSRDVPFSADRRQIGLKRRLVAMIMLSHDVHVLAGEDDVAARGYATRLHTHG